MNQSKSKATFFYEKGKWRQRYKYVAGIDEVGRGSFAGPVVAAAVVFSPKVAKAINDARKEGIRIDDSKKLTELERRKANIWIRKNCITWGVGGVSVAKINRIGMAKASNMAFRRAVSNANRRFLKRIDYLLIDYYFAPYIRGLPMTRKRARLNNNLKDSNSRQLAIKNGDEKSISIASASIVAKVYRDRLMTKLGNKHKHYLWEKNKGYGTFEHRNAIKKYGITKFHRKKYVENYLKKTKKD